MANLWGNLSCSCLSFGPIPKANEGASKARVCFDHAEIAGLVMMLHLIRHMCKVACLKLDSVERIYFCTLYSNP